MVMTEERKPGVEDRIVVELHELYDNPWQPRLAVDSEYILQLAEDIRTFGLLQEPTVRPRPQGGYELAFGHSRVKALMLLTAEHDWPSTVEVKIKDLSDEEMAYVALSENRVRKDLTRIEVLNAWKKAIAIDGVTIQSLADRVGVDRTTMSKNLSILDMPDVVLIHIASGAMSLRAARELLCLRNDEHMLTDMIEAVIADCMWSSPYGNNSDGRPDFRSATVRQSIMALTRGTAYRAYDKHGHEDMEKRWRPLFADGPGGRPISFDVEEFKRTFPKSIYKLPSGPESGREEWTTEVKEWSKWSARATREQTKAESQAGSNGASPKPEPKPKGSKWLQAVKKDPLVIERLDAKTLRRFKTAEDLSVEERLDLGTRVVKSEEPSYSDKVIDLPMAAQPDIEGLRHGGGDSPPMFDFSECATCTSGATWMQTWYEGDMHLVCTNKQAYMDKKSVGIEQFLIERSALAARDVREDNELAERLAETLPDIQAMLIVMSHIDWVAKAPTVRAWDHAQWRKYDIYPAAAQEFAVIVGSELPPVGDTNMIRERWAKNVNMFFGDVPYDYDWRVPAALVLIWQARVCFGLGVPLGGAGKDAEATPDAVSSES